MKKIYIAALLSTYLFSCENNEKEIVIQPEIANLSVTAGFAGETVTIKGIGFSEDIGDVSIIIGSKRAIVTSTSKTEIEFVVPEMKTEFDEIDLKIKNVDCKIKPTFRALTWKKLIDVPFELRYSASSFIIDDKIYTGLGRSLSNFNFGDFWEINALSGRVKQLKNFPGSTRFDCKSFSIKSKGYIVLGRDSTLAQLNELWEYDAKSDSWTRKADFPGNQRDEEVVFVLNNEVYVGNGLANGSTSLTDFYKYDPTSDKWSSVISFPDGRYGQAAFEINNKAYLIGGVKNNSEVVNEVWEFDKKAWIQKSSFPGINVADGIAFSSPNFHFFGFGENESNQSEISNYLYRPNNDTWTRINDFPGAGRRNPISNSNSKYGYFGLGYSGSSFEGLSDIWVIDLKDRNKED